MKAGDWVYLGYVERAHGLRGRIVARLVLAGAVRPVDTGTVLRLGRTEHRVVRSTVRDSQRITLQFDDLFTREQAEEIRGESLFMRRSSIEPGDGLFPLHAFAGMELRSDGFTGLVEEVRYSEANPLLLVRGSSGLFPVPVAMIMSGKTDWESGVIEVELPAGLMDIEVD